MRGTCAAGVILASGEVIYCKHTIKVIHEVRTKLKICITRKVVPLIQTVLCSHQISNDPLYLLAAKYKIHCTSLL